MQFSLTLWLEPNYQQQRPVDLTQSDIDSWFFHCAIYGDQKAFVLLVYALENIPLPDFNSDLLFIQCPLIILTNANVCMLLCSHWNQGKRMKHGALIFAYQGILLIAPDGIFLNLNDIHAIEV